MVVCGMELAAAEARLVILSGTKDSFLHIAVNPPKLVLADDESPDEVKAFRDAIFAFLRENAVEKISIKKRVKRGGYAGGAVSFKIEGIIQLYLSCPIRLVSPNSIAAAQRRYNPSIPASIRQYQQAAFETAFTELE